MPEALLEGSGGHLGPRANISPKKSVRGSALDPLVGIQNPRKSVTNRFQHQLKHVSFLQFVFFIDFFSTWLRFGPVWWSKMEPCWALDTIQEAKQNQIAKIARNGTAPRRELYSEGVAVLKMTTKLTTNPSEMDANIDQKSDHILTSIVRRFLVDFGRFSGPSWSPKSIEN